MDKKQANVNAARRAVLISEAQCLHSRLIPILLLNK
ncbi:MAG: hypothetical protein ACJAT7_003575 [Psychromonas sp.]|jgi:hypothetical protein